MKNTSLKPQTNIPQSKPYIHEVQNISDSIYEDEMVKYINDLSNSIKQIYKSNIMNFKQMTNILETENQNNNQLNKESNDYYKNLVHDTFNNIKESFTTFYQNAKDIFKKMKQYRSQKIEIEMKKDLNLKAKKNNQIQKTNLENNNKISLLNDEINQLKIKNSDLQIQLNSLNIAYKKTKEFLEYQNSNNNHINKVYSQEQTKFLETQLSLLSKKNIELSSKLFATNNNNTLKKEKDEINQKLNNDILLLNEKVNNLENIITVLNNEKEKMENEKQKLIEENKKMNEEFEKLNYNNTNNQLKEIIDINKKLISDKENYKNIISEKNELLLKQKTEIEKLNKNIITEKERSLKLSNMIGEYKVNNLEKEENSKKQIQLYNQKEDELKKQIEKLNKEIDIKDKANSLLNEKLSKKEEEILKFNQNMNMNENQNENLKKKIIEISELNKKNLREINNLQEELKIAKTNEIKLMKDIKEKEIQFDSLNKTIENYQNLIIDTEKKMNMKNNEIDRIKNEKENEKKELQNKTNKYEIEKKELQNKINKYEIEKKELNNNLNKIEKEKEELNEKINQLNRNNQK